MEINESTHLLLLVALLSARLQAAFRCLAAAALLSVGAARRGGLFGVFVVVIAMESLEQAGQLIGLFGVFFILD